MVLYRPRDEVRDLIEQLRSAPFDRTQGVTPEQSERFESLVLRSLHDAASDPDIVSYVIRWERFFARRPTVDEVLDRAEAHQPIAL